MNHSMTFNLPEDQAALHDAQNGHKYREVLKKLLEGVYKAGLNFEEGTAARIICDQIMTEADALLKNRGLYLYNETHEEHNPFDYPMPPAI